MDPYNSTNECMGYPLTSFFFFSFFLRCLTFSELKRYRKMDAIKPCLKCSFNTKENHYLFFQNIELEIFIYLFLYHRKPRGLAQKIKKSTYTHRSMAKPFRDRTLGRCVVAGIPNHMIIIISLAKYVGQWLGQGFFFFFLLA